MKLAVGLLAPKCWAMIKSCSVSLKHKTFRKAVSEPPY
ncbi:hypothetical protein [Enterobacter phage N5822]|nr:hypothetical protein [Enterobacter phage N5822]